MVRKKFQGFSTGFFCIHKYKELKLNIIFSELIETCGGYFYSSVDDKVFFLIRLKIKTMNFRNHKRKNIDVSLFNNQK